MLKTITIPCTFGLLMLASGPAGADADLALSQNTFDFGFAPQNSSLTCRFWLRSSGTDTLKILSVKPACGCTKAPLARDILPPGDSTMLEITFNSGASRGLASKSVAIATNTAIPDRRITFSSNVVAAPDSTFPIAVKPHLLDLAHQETTASQELKFAISNRSTDDLTVSLVDAPRDYFDIVLPEKIAAGSTAEGALRVKSEKAASDFRKSFTIALNDPTNSRFTIPVVNGARPAVTSRTH